MVGSGAGHDRRGGTEGQGCRQRRPDDQADGAEHRDEENNN
jgi:hypothetical protein